MNDDLLEWLDCPCSSKVCLPRTAKAHIEAQAAEIDYWKTEARNVRRELKSEQKQTDSAMDNYDAMQRRCEAQAAEIEKLRSIVRGWHYLAVGPDEMGDYYTQKQLIKASEPYMSPALKALKGRTDD